MISEPEIIAEGILVPEGPVWCADGTIVVTSVAEGVLYRIWPSEKRKEVLARTAGGPNAAVPATDGCFLVTQNGGMDFNQLGVPGPWPIPDRVSPGLQLVRADGKIVRLLDGMQAPNDLVVAPDGTIFFTDPSIFPAPPGSLDSRVMSLAIDGSLKIVADGLHFCNGIAREADGNLLITEANGLMRVYLDGRKEWIIEDVFDGGHGVDGLCIDVDGRVYMAGGLEHGVRIVENGERTDFLPIPGEGLTTNCCFGGPDNRWLIVTDGLPGNVLIFRDLPAPGLSVVPWPVQTARS